MKRWQVEQILYLNDTGRKKLTMPDSRQLIGQSFRRGVSKRENLFLGSLRKCFTCLSRIL